jgi:phospholipid/cholesterol/gamma-HCH transport system substrate-binding protein
MQKQAPSAPRILTMVLFALSCFGLLLFLWLSFGGSVPLKPRSYRFKVAIPEAAQLGLEADVRVAGVRVGKVREKELDPHGNRTLATIEVDRRYAPIRSNATAILRQKTLLGETYLEMTPGTKNAPFLKEDGILSARQVKPTVELDEIFEAFDPNTRQAFRTWQQELAKLIQSPRRGQDLSDAFGNLPVFSTEAADLFETLNSEQQALRGTIRDTGSVFEAITRNEGALSRLITSSDRVFDATASQNDALATSFQIFPTFLDESKLTLARLQTFARKTDPLIQDLRPATRDLTPTLRDVRLLAPDLRNLFDDLDPLITASKRGLPALRDILKGASPLFAETGPFLSQLNPILQYLELYQKQLTDFIEVGGSGIAATYATKTAGSAGHYLRQFGPQGIESVAVYPNRLSSNRGNSYPPPLFLADRDSSTHEIFPNWDCNNTGAAGDGSVPYSAGNPAGNPANQHAACFVAKPNFFAGKTQGKFAHVDAGDYSK